MHLERMLIYYLRNLPYCKNHTICTICFANAGYKICEVETNDYYDNAAPESCNIRKKRILYMIHYQFGFVLSDIGFVSLDIPTKGCQVRRG